MSLELRVARATDVPVLSVLIENSARALSAGYYTLRQIDAAVRHVFGIDSTLIEDGTYLAAIEDGEIVGCGGWSRRRTLYGGDQRPVGASDMLDPAKDAARPRCRACPSMPSAVFARWSGSPTCSPTVRRSILCAWSDQSSE